MTDSIVSNSLSLVNVSAQGGLLKISLPKGRPGKGGKRGKVTKFSRASRKRMIEMFASFHYDYKNPPLFLTLTYPDDEIPDGNEYSQLKAFLERIRRRYPETSGIWRKEVEKRKSGKFIGRSVPHFHVILFDIPSLKYQDVKLWWGEIIGTGSKHLQVKVEPCQNRRKAFAYVSKYVAKMTDDSGVEPAPPTGFNEDGAGKNKVPLTIAHNGTLGRWWGVFNRDFLPFGELLEGTFQIPMEVFYAFRRDARKIFELIDSFGYIDESGKFKRQSVRDKGFTLFVDNPYRWVELLWHYLQQFCFANDCALVMV